MICTTQNNYLGTFEYKEQNIFANLFTVYTDRSDH